MRRVPPASRVRRMTTLKSTTQHRLGNAWRERLLRLAVAGALAGLMLAVASARGTAETTLTAPNVPAAVQVPDGQTLRFRAYAFGTQNYECQTTEAGTTAWTFRQPMAELVGDAGESLGIHGRGPFWVGYDGSRVVGSAPTSAPGVDPTQDIPLLLLRATSRRSRRSLRRPELHPTARHPRRRSPHGPMRSRAGANPGRALPGGLLLLRPHGVDATTSHAAARTADLRLVYAQDGRT